MDQIMEIIKKRRSVRKYKDEPLPKDVIDSLLEAARHAPSARNLQQLEYKVITNKELIQKMSESIVNMMKKRNPINPSRANPGKIFYGAPIVIVLTGPKENEWIGYDASIAIQNIMLYATSINLGSCFIGFSRFMNEDKEILNELRIPDDKKVVAAVVCGYADEKPGPMEKGLKVEFFQ
jgi:nitroreductase